MSKSIIKSLTFLALIAAVACKPQSAGDASSIKTLDNFTRADGSSVTTYFCGINMTPQIYGQLTSNDRHVVDDRIVVEGKSSVADALAWRYAAGGALAAAPKAMQTVFLASKGKIRVVDDAKAACEKANLSASEKKFASENAGNSAATPVDGCWDKSSGVLNVIVRKDKAAIHHGLLRLLTYAYTQLFVGHLSDAATAVPADLKTQFAAGVDRFKKQRYALGVALIQDLYAANHVAQAKSFEAFAESDREGYENHVFTEVVDSAYCSATSRAVFEADFKKTWTAFATGQDSLLKDFGAPLY